MAVPTGRDLARRSRRARVRRGVALGALPWFCLGCAPHLQTPRTGPPGVSASPAPVAAAPPAPVAPPPVAAPNLAPEPALVPVFQDPDRRAKIAAAFPKLDALLASQLAAQGLPGLAFGVVIDGELAYVRGLGVRDLDGKQPVDADTVFRIGSITKTFTALAVLQLRDAGKLWLDEPVARVLPELGALRYPTRDSAPITIRQILTHTSGLPEWGNLSHALAGHEPSESELFNDLPRLALLSAPGTRYAYSNFGMALLGPVVSRLSGLRYRDYVTQRIFAPLGMRATFWNERDVPKGRLATGYVPGPAGPVSVAPWWLGSMEAAGGIFTSLADLGRYAAFQLAAYPPRDEVETGPLRRSSVREAHAPAWHIGLAVESREPSPRHPAIVGAYARGVGLAWHGRETCEVEEIVGHNGAVDGFGAAIELFPQRGVALVALANYRDTDFGPIVGAATEILLESGGAAPRALPVSERLGRAMAGLTDLYAHFDEARYRQIFAPLFVDAVPLPEVVREAERLKKVHGACRRPTAVEVRSPSSGRFTASCERGRWEVDAEVDALGRIVGASITSYDVAPPLALVTAAGRVAALVARWDERTYAELLAPTFGKPAMEALFGEIRAKHKSCAVGKPIGGDAGTNASFALACKIGGDLSLALKLDEGGARALGMRIAPLASTAGGKCPER